jgi:hypothetical protein
MVEWAGWKDRGFHGKKVYSSGVSECSPGSSVHRLVGVSRVQGFNCIHPEKSGETGMASIRSTSFPWLDS